jgi:hypothetical protein
MRLKDLDAHSDSKDWSQKWGEIFDRYQTDLRNACYVHAVLDAQDRHVLEIGAGSFRDVAELRRRAIDCVGIDFSSESVFQAKRFFSDFANCFHQMNAFHLGFSDKSFDVSYHNGFWVLFSDENIRLLLREQLRVTRSKLIATVHNAHNQDFVKYFDEKKQIDPLFDIRFFEVDELVALMSPVCSRVEIYPVGKEKRYHEDAMIAAGVVDPASIRRCLVSQGMSYLQSSERLMCVGYL